MSWYRWVGTDGVVLGIERFGASAPYERMYTELGLTVDKLVAAAEGLVSGTDGATAAAPAEVTAGKKA